MNQGLLFKDECYAVQGAIFAVYKELGRRFRESVYQECLERELKRRTIPFESQKELRVVYKGASLRQTLKADLICYDSIIVEIKAVRQITEEHRAQVFDYLKVSGLHLGLLVNFGHYPKATVERIII